MKVGDKVKITFNAKPELAEYLIKRAESKGISITRFLTTLISKGKFIQDSINSGDNIYVGLDIDNLRQVDFHFLESN